MTNSKQTSGTWNSKANQELFLKDIKRTRGIDFAFIGQTVIFGKFKKIGRITGLNSSANLLVKVRGIKGIFNVHPTYIVKYISKDGDVVREFSE